MSQPLDTVRQLAYVTRDLDAAVKYWGMCYMWSVFSS